MIVEFWKLERSAYTLWITGEEPNVFVEPEEWGDGVMGWTDKAQRGWGHVAGTPTEGQLDPTGAVFSDLWHTHVHFWNRVVTSGGLEHEIHVCILPSGGETTIRKLGSWIFDDERVKASICEKEGVRTNEWNCKMVNFSLT